MPSEPKPFVSALIVARNEERNLGACLASLSWVSEIVVVVDATSKDATETIARRHPTRVVVRTFDTFAGQRNAGLGLVRGDWVFAIDADERVTLALASEIRSVLADPAQTHSGFRVPIRSVVLGRRFRFSGTQYDCPLRLFRRSAGRWVGDVHETVDLRDSVGTLRHHLEHRTLDDIKTFLRKINRYTSLDAHALYRHRVPFRLVDLMLRPLWVFAKLYVGKQGFRDGLEGFAFCALSGFSEFVKRWKLRELIQDAGRVREPSASQGSLIVRARPTARSARRAG